MTLTIGRYTFDHKFFETLDEISKTWSQRKAAKRLGISHAVLNRRIKSAEEKLGFKLLDTTGAGSGLTDTAWKILLRYKKYEKRLKEREKLTICGGYVSSGLLEILSSEYGLDAIIYRTDDESAMYLAEMDMIDLLALDDPVHAFMRDLDFIPIAYDHLVLVSGDTQIDDLSDLNGKKFIEVPNSSQRLAWNTLDNKGIKYQIIKQCKSPYTALETVKNSKDLYTFLNSSFSSGSNIIKDETRHIISVVVYKKHEKTIDDFIDFILDKGQNVVERCGFERIR